MSQGWEREDWRLDEARSRRLPQVEDLPQTGDGYDRAAVEAAFEAFYRHAAEVDRTLDVLESVAAFQREAGALRADIRALRAASWGPVPTLRHTVATTAVGRVDRRPAPLEAWPRIALYSALIIFVAVGSAAADLSSGAIVALVLASWLVVGVAELAVSGLGGRVRTAPRGYPGRAEEPAAEAAAVAEPVSVPAAEPVAEEPDEEPEPEEPRAWRPWSRPEEPAVEVEPVPEPGAEDEAEVEPVVAAEAEAEPEAEPAPVLEAEPDIEPAAELEPEFVPALEPFGAAPEAPPQPVEIVPQLEPFEEPEPVAEAEPEPEAEAEAEPETEQEPETEPVAEAEPRPESVEPVEPAPARRLRFWRRRPADEPAALEPLPEPRHVRIVEVEDAAPEEPVPVEVEVAEPELAAPERGEPEAVEAEAAIEAEPEREAPEAEPEPEAPEAEPEPAEAEPPAAETEPAEVEPPAAEMEPEPEPDEPPENLEDTDERPAVAATPSSLRLRRGRR